MKYSQEFNVDTFPWWSGAKDTIAEVRKANKMTMFGLTVKTSTTLLV